MTNNKQNISKSNLSTPQYWENVWGGYNLPISFDLNRPPFLLLDILFKKYLKKEEGLRFLEVGCAPGGWLNYFYKEFGYEVHGIEYTEGGSELARKNLNILNVPSLIYHEDIFSVSDKKEYFDLVFSSGLIEHFENNSKIIEAHLNLLKKGGMLVIGVPNLTNINYSLQSILNKDVLKIHNLEVMSIDYFDRNIVEKYNLRKIYLGYCGFFYPFLFSFKIKNKLTMSILRILNLFVFLIDLFIVSLNKITNHFITPDSRFYSPYIFLIAKKQ